MNGHRQSAIGIDIGGTFTDVCLWDGRTFSTAKAPTTPADPVQGVLAALDQLGVPSGEFVVVQGSTVATNALLERKGARVAFVTTMGMSDILRIGRQNRPKLYDLHVRKPPPIIDPANCFEVPERVDAEGNVVHPFDENAARDLIDAIKARGIDHIALCFLFSFLNPAHELAFTDIAKGKGVTVSRSSEILPAFREFERASTTAVNAYVAPLMSRYLEQLEQALKQRGVRRLRVMQSNGGQTSAAEASRLAVHTVLSGPAGGVVAAHAVGKAVGEDKLIAYDMGGTSTDVSLCIGEPGWRTDSIVDGWPIGVPMLDIHTVGAGGGSIAKLDAAGALQVGPESAGADPGPACYGKSDRPTVTDAHVVLGRIRPEYFLGGQMPIDANRAAQAVGRLAAQMNAPVEEAAVGIIRVANANMERAVKTVSAARGHDPRACMLVSFGGAGGLHACDLATAIGMRGVIIPANGGILSAVGMLQADIIRDDARSLPKQTDIDLELLRRTFADMMEDASQKIIADGYDYDDAVIERFADMRYAGQSHELTIPIESLTDVERLLAPFHQAHERHFGYADRTTPVEIVTLRTRTIISTDKPTPPRLISGQQAATVAHHPIGLTSGETASVAFLNRDSLASGHAGQGPTLIVEPHATSLIPPGWSWTMHETGHLICQPDASKSSQ